MKTERGWTMEETLKKMCRTLSDAGCDEEAIRKAERLIGSDDLLRYLRLCRCERMEELHESQRKVDLMDHLIRDIEKKNGKGRK